MSWPKGSLEAIEVELRRLALRLERIRLKEAAGQGTRTLDRSAYLVLGCLSELGPVRLGAVADTLGLNASTVSRQVLALENSGLIEKIPDPSDGRACVLQVTDSGSVQFSATRRERHEILNERLSEWSSEDMVELARLLNKYNEAIERSPKEDLH